MIEAQLIYTPDIITGRMKGERDKWVKRLIIHTILLVFETEHSQQLTFRIFVVPYSDGVVEFRARSDQRTL
jgi:hypothetical protein